MFEDKFAKSKKFGYKTIVEHTKDVVDLAMSFADLMEKSKCTDEFKEHVALIAILHDIGKFTNSFQKYIKGKNEIDEDNLESIKYNSCDNTKEYHNTISWAFAVSCLNRGDSDSMSDITSPVLFHHIVRSDKNKHSKEIMKSILEDEPDTFEDMKNFYTYMIGYVDSKYGTKLCHNDNYRLILDKKIFHDRKIGDEQLFSFVKFRSGMKVLEMKEEIELSSYKSINHAILNWSDRTASSGSYVSFLYSKKSNFSKKDADLSKYDIERLDVQLEIIEKIVENKIRVNVLTASAGFGKTLMGILWLIENKEKGIWVLPTNSLTESTFRSVVRELEKMGLNDVVKVCSFITGEIKDSNHKNCKLEECDIIITNIDNYLNRSSKNNFSKFLVYNYFGNVIFDEYQDFRCGHPMFPAFINSMQNIMHYTNGKCLLMSATAPDFKNLWFGDSDKINFSNDLPVHSGDVKVNIKLYDCYDGNIPVKLVKQNSFTICKTVDDARNVYLKSNEPKLLVHSIFRENRRKEISDEIFDMYGKESTKDKKSVVSTSLIGTGWDISAKSMNDFCILPDDTIQHACGRLGRFNEYDEVDYNVLYDFSGDCLRYIMYRYEPWNYPMRKTEDSDIVKLYKKWIGVLKSYDGKTITKNKMYELYRDFYKENEEMFVRYYTNLYNNGMNGLVNITLKGGSNNKKYDGVKMVSRGYTYRGVNGNVFVTVKTPDGFLEPIVCSDFILEKEKDTPEEAVKRYKFMLDKTLFDFPDKRTLKRVYGITSVCDIKSSSELSYRSDRPTLLFNHDYNDELGLYPLS